MDEAEARRGDDHVGAAEGIESRGTVVLVVQFTLYVISESLQNIAKHTILLKQ